jgi:hypothetical protein
MGGGAGIEFKIGEFADSSSEEISLTALDTILSPSIEWFDAHGYMDGMDKVDGALLLPIGLDGDFSEILNSEDVKAPGEYTIIFHYSTEYSKWKTMLFSGYTRGKFTKDTVLSFEGDAEYEVFCDGEAIMWGDIEVALSYTPNETALYWYEDVFDSTEIPEEEWDNWLHELEDNYGYYNRILR